ncbi:MAG: sodium:proton antiporter, partial [Alphaproteobacteria bacterium CG_4_10_14_0_8_um_filter_53_9]
MKKIAISKELGGGLALVFAALAALLFVNFGGAELYTHIFEIPVGMGKDFHKLINDGLMALFFLLVGIELRRERAVGELKDARH